MTKANKKRNARRTLEKRIALAVKEWATTKAAIERGFFNPIVAWETKAQHEAATRNMETAALELVELERADAQVSA